MVQLGLRPQSVFLVQILLMLLQKLSLRELFLIISVLQVAPVRKSRLLYLCCFLAKVVRYTSLRDYVPLSFREGRAGTLIRLAAHFFELEQLLNIPFLTKIFERRYTDGRCVF